MANLLTEARALKQAKPGYPNWFSKLSTAQKKQVRTIIKEFHAGKYEAGKYTLAKWLIGRLALSVKPEAVARFIDSEKPA